MRTRRSLLCPLVVFALVAIPVGATAQPAPQARAAAPAAALTPLVADAGGSVLVDAGEYVTLLGSGYGGVDPYTFAWSSPLELLHATEPQAQVDTEGVTPGTHEAMLTITDAAGATAQDTVRFAIAGDGVAAGETVLLDQTTPDGPAPGVTMVSGSLDFPFTVPEGVSSLRVDLSWDQASDDYDLRVLDPEGNEAASSGTSAGAPEATSVASPVPGEWTVAADRFLTEGGAEVHAVVTATLAGPAGGAGLAGFTIDAAGPYRFATGTPQQLTGTVTGGTAPLEVGWDLDLDGLVEVPGTGPAVDLPDGRHLVVLHARDGEGFERQQMTSVLVGSEERIREETVPITVIGLADSGINPYHEELSAATYPDPEVLELTRNFTRHPSEYIPGYPADARALPITLGQGYFPDQDLHLWKVNELPGGTLEPEYIEAGALYWIPGTKIIGAVDAGGSTGATSGSDTHPVLDDNGHGTGSSTVSTGNRYGYCPTCLLVNVEALDESVVAKADWIDISSNSFGYIGGLPIGYVLGPNEITRAAAERGQLTLFAAGNGVGNAFDVPISTYGSDQTGPDWNITVGAIREDNQGAVIGDGIPAHLSALGDGDLPSACRVGVNAQCAFGGTSAATPYTAGVFGTTLTNIRAALGDHSRPGQLEGQVIAQGTPIPASPFLSDGQLTREELRAVVLKTSTPNFENDGSVFVYPATYEGQQGRVVVEGYGAANPNSATRATAVLLGELPLPARPQEDSFFAEDCALRDEQYGSFDRTGDGEADGCEASAVLALTGDGVPTNDPASPGTDAYAPARGAVDQPYGDVTPYTYFLHRILDIEPDRREPSEEDEDGEPAPRETQGSCVQDDNAQFMNAIDFERDNEPCFDAVRTGFVAGFRPKGIFAAEDIVRSPLPTGSTVQAEVYLGSAQGGPVELIGVLNATDRTVAEGSAGTKPVVPSGDPAGCSALGEACWTRYDVTLTTERPVAAGEQLTFQVNLVGAPDFAFGHEAGHVSKLTVTPAALPETGVEFGVTVDEPVADAAVGEDGRLVVSGRVAFPDLGLDPQLAGFHPTVERVEVAVDDPDFRRPTYATLDRVTGIYQVELDGLAGAREIAVRALRDRFPSPVVTRSLAVAPQPAPPPAPQPPERVFERVAGSGRVETALGLSQEAFPDGAPAAILARADTWPDALAASTLAAEVGGPVLLTSRDELDSRVASELDRLGATTVYLTGGVDALSEDVEADSAADGRDVQRLAGLDRIATATEIAREVVELGGPVARAIIARGDTYVDALAAGNLATAARAPILLTPTNRLDDRTADALAEVLDGDSVVIAGGTAAIDAGVEAALGDAGYAVERLAGTERYATAVALVEAAFTAGADPDPSLLASGVNFPDALTAVPVAHQLGGAVLLVDPFDLDDSAATRELLDARASQITTVLVAGGPEAISDGVVAQVAGTLQE